MTRMTRTDFIDMVIRYQAVGCGDRDIRGLSDRQREIIAAAARDTEDVALEDLEQNQTIRSGFVSFINATFPAGRCTFVIDGKAVDGVNYGDDEMFGLDYFYQYFLADDGTLYKLMYDASRPDVNTGDLSDVDYDRFDDYKII